MADRCILRPLALRAEEYWLDFDNRSPQRRKMRCAGSDNPLISIGAFFKIVRNRLQCRPTPLRQYVDCRQWLHVSEMESRSRTARNIYCRRLVSGVIGSTENWLIVIGGGLFVIFLGSS